MQSGHPLTDTDRAPWLDTKARTIDLWHARGACRVITCSALKRAHRGRIIGNRRGGPLRGGTTFVNRVPC